MFIRLNIRQAKVGLSEGVRDVTLMGPLACALLALGWLFPNHHRPWLSFHSEAWIAAGLTLALIVVVLRVPSPCRFSTSFWVLLVVSGLPWLQHMAGLIPLPGDAWVSFAFLFGFALAVALGETWQDLNTDAPLDFMFGAIAIAAIACVGLQLYQMLGLTKSDGIADIWVLYLDDRGRPYANMGQPNQLATLLIWGLIAIAWALHKRAIRATVAFGVCVYLVLGVALTQSRTAMLTLTLCVAAFWFLRGRLFTIQWFRGTLAIFAIFWLFVLSIGPVGRWLSLAIEASFVDRTQGEARFPAWRMFLDATMESPLLGYGWEHTREAQLAVAVKHPDMAHQLYSHAHNLFLDLVLWTGWPVGLVLSGLILHWLWQTFKSVSSHRQLLVFGALCALGVHAMLELPMHYAYFLLPAGVFAGVLNRLRSGPLLSWTIGKWTFLAMTLTAAILLCAIVRDYFLVEESLVDLRFETQRIGTNHNRKPPPTWLLNHWQDLIQLGREQPDSEMSPEEVEHLKALTLYYPSSANYEKMLKALSMNGRHDEAKYWAERACAFFDEQTCVLVRSRWRASLPVDKGVQDTPDISR